ncbi:stage V sporulation protein AD [Halalkalibacillus halophilus]|uniref:stage V sporulation protein AD n=1 Tax=Halalkalibacillus halophilus TaxID=392827 RepID=UPI000412D025|nr:stage V sporulation protein AD [Halalkalibacillus halophilus]
MKKGKYSWDFTNGVYINSHSVIVGPKESEGPLASYYDMSFDDLHFEEKTWEQAERKMLKKTIEETIAKSGYRQDSIDILISGDLMNQNTAANYVARDYDIPFLGVFGACSTSMEALAIAASLVDGHQVNRAVTGTCSHYATAEKQFRYPTEYGGQKPDTSTSTVTGAASILIQKSKDAIQVEGATIGKVIDFGMNDPFDMGSAMAPAAAETITSHFKDFNRTADDYDLILTGDLSSVGTPILDKLMVQSGYDLGDKYKDCGSMIYYASQNVFAGGSGCAASAVVTYSYILKEMKEKRLNNVLIVATGALLSPTVIQQKETIPCIAHAISLKRVEQ